MNTFIMILCLLSLFCAGWFIVLSMGSAMYTEEERKAGLRDD